MAIRGLLGFGGGATGLAAYVADSAEVTGCIFDWDPGRISMSNNAIATDGTDLAAGLSYTDTAANGSSSGVTITVNGGSFKYKTANGGNFLADSGNQGRITIGNGGSPKSMGGDGGLLDTKSMTIETWMQYNGSGRDVCVSRYGSGYPNQFNHIFDPGGQFHFNSSGVNLGSGDRDWDAFGDNVWFHCIWLYNIDDGYMRWYVNNVEKGTNNAGTNSGNGMETDSNTGWSIASRADRMEDLEGMIGIVRLYNKALTTSEIAARWNATRSRYGL